MKQIFEVECSYTLKTNKFCFSALVSFDLFFAYLHDQEKT